MRGRNEKVIAIFLADIHLSLTPPIWRSAEPNWLEAMQRPLDEVRDLQKKFNCPVICIGDIFDRWNSPPELINFALDYLPDDMYAIPGQHDLPLHQYEDMERSAYWTLEMAGKIKDVTPGCFPDIGGIALHAFPYGHPLHPLGQEWGGRCHIAIVHEYAWIDGHCYPNAPVENKVVGKGDQMKKKKWLGYHMVVYGDNHKGFLTYLATTAIFNCGTLMRRKSDEVDYKPQVGMLLESGKVRKHYLDISKDKHLDVRSAKGVEDSLDMKGFIQELEKLGDSDLDFSGAMKQYLKKNKIKMEICNIIMKAVGL